MRKSFSSSRLDPRVRLRPWAFDARSGELFDPVAENVYLCAVSPRHDDICYSARIGLGETFCALWILCILF